jgi:hypothetical protein
MEYFANIMLAVMLSAVKYTPCNSQHRIDLNEPRECGPPLKTALNFRVAVPSWSFEGTEGFSLRICDSVANFSYALRKPKSHPSVLIRELVRSQARPEK